MSEIKVILLCGSRMALPVMRDLFFFKQLAVVVIPEHCTEFIQEVELLLKDSGIPVLTVTKKDYTSKLLLAIKKYTPTLGLMVTFTYKLPASVYNMPAKGFFNMHPGPLPAYRGPDPVFQQIKNREEYAAVTIHKVDDDFDTGQVVLSDKIRLLVTDTHGILTSKLAELAARLVGVLIKMAGLDIDIPSRIQNNENIMYYKRQSAIDITINWATMDAETIIALANACNPWNKGAVTKLNNKIIRVLEAEKIIVENNTDKAIAPGNIIAIEEKGIIVSTIFNSRIRVTYVYTDEGFLPASRMRELGFSAGNMFQEIFNAAN